MCRIKQNNSLASGIDVRLRMWTLAWLIGGMSECRIRQYYVSLVTSCQNRELVMNTISSQAERHCSHMLSMSCRHLVLCLPVRPLRSFISQPISAPKYGKIKHLRFSRHHVRYISHSTAFVPPSPESLGRARPAREYRTLLRWGRRLAFVSFTAGTFYFVDKQFYASSISRSMRSFWLGIIVAADYKLNFRPDPWFGGDITDLHRRNAQRIFEHLHTTGGLYLKVRYL